MNFIIRELQKHISTDLPNSKEMVNVFTSLAYEVEEIIPANIIKGVKLGKVLECEKHPDADKLNYCKVETDGKVWDVICGGANIKAGQIVAHAFPGTKVGDLELQPKELRGIISNGMVLSVGEIGGFGKEVIETEEQKNIIAFDDHTDMESDPAEAAGLTGDIFDLSILPDRQYASNYLTMAKEVAAYLGYEFIKPEVNFESNGTIDTNLVLGEKATSLYSNRVKLENSQTPQEIKNLLYQSGKQVTNTIEDVIAYVKLLTGIVVYATKPADTIKLIDRELIVDDKKIDIINGGAVHTDKEEIQLTAISSEFSANIVNETIAEKFYGHTNIKGTNTELTETAVKLVNTIGQQLGYISESTDVKGINNFEQRTIELDEEFFNNYVGKKVDITSLTAKMEAIGFKADWNKFNIPAQRTDVVTQQDLAEELIRFFGIENIEPVAHDITTDNLAEESNKKALFNTVNELVKYGFFEAKTYQLINEEDSNKYNVWGIEKLIKLNKEYSLEYNTLQTSLLKGLIETHNTNYRDDFEDVRFFEVSNIFFDEEPKLVAGLIHDEKINEEDPILATKELVYKTLEANEVSRDRVEFVQMEDNDIFNPFQSALIKVDGNVKGFLGEIHPKILREYKYIRVDKVKAKLYYAEIIIND